MVMTIIPTILNMAIFMMVTLKVLASLGRHDHGQLGSAVRGWMGCALVIIIMRDSKAEILLKFTSSSNFAFNANSMHYWL